MKDIAMKKFVIIWSGQFLSRIGTSLTRFALLIWAYQQTDSASAVALLGFFAFLPLIAVSPFAGVWIDRFNRRNIMLASDIGAGLMTLGLLLLHTSGNLQLWHLYAVEALTGTFEAFQAPAYTALTSQLLPKEQYARANGLRSVADAGSMITAPVVAGLLLTLTGIAGVMIIDLATLIAAVITLSLVSIPSLAIVPNSDDLDSIATTPGHRYWQEMGLGFGYIWKRPGLMGLAVIYMGLNLLDGLTWLSILPVMILARSGGDELALATVQGSFGVAGVFGGLLISIWGGPKRKIHGALMGPALSFLTGGILIAVGRSVLWWGVAAWLAMFFVPFISSSIQSIFQSKVAPGVQGRVLSVYDMMRHSTLPLGVLLGGLLADKWFEPAMMPGGSMLPTFGPIVGTGPGAGMALMFFATAVIGTIIALLGYLVPAIRRVEGELPDQDEIPLDLVGQTV